MASRLIPGISLRAFWALGEAGWKAGMDENIWRLSFLVQSRVLGIVTELPIDPEEGDRYILNDAVSPYDQYILVYDQELWIPVEPQDRFVVFNTENDSLMYFNLAGNTWISLISPEAIKEAYESNPNTNEFTDDEKAKLSGIEDDATADMSAAEIKVAYESNTNTNAFTDAEKAKLSGLSSSRFLGVYPTLSNLQAAHPAPAVGSFAYVDLGPTADIMSYIWDANSNKYVPQASGNTQETPETIKEKYESNDDTNAFTDADKSKLDGIEAGASGDLSGSEIKSLYEAEADTNAFTDTEKSKLAGIESGATADMSNAEIKSAYEANTNTNAFTDAEQSKLAGIENGATGDQTAAEIKAAYESNSNTNAYTDAEKTKLDSLIFFSGSYNDLDDIPDTIPDASSDGKVYARKDGAWVEVERFYNFSIFIPGKPSDAETVLFHKAVTAFSFPINFTGSNSVALAASTNDVYFSVKKNGIEFGTIRYNISGTGAYTAASAVTIAVGDVLTIDCPTPVDDTLSDISINLKGSVV